MLDTEIKRRRRTRGDNQNTTSTGSTGMQWTLKNVDPDTVELSRQAARKRGMKFGAWVTQALREAAQSEIEEKERGQRSGLLSKIEEFESKLDQRIETIQRQGREIQHDLRVLQLLVPAAASK